MRQRMTEEGRDIMTDHNSFLDFTRLTELDGFFKVFEKHPELIPVRNYPLEVFLRPVWKYRYSFKCMCIFRHIYRVKLCSRVQKQEC